MADRTIFGLSPGQVLGILAVIGIAVGLTYTVSTGDLDTADVGADVVDIDGEFEQVGLSDSQLDAPFEAYSQFENITVDRDATDGTTDVLDGASYTWNVDNGTDLGLVSRSAAVYYETDGYMEDVEHELTDQTTGTNYEDGVSITDASLYDYEAAVDAGSLDAGLVGDFELDGDMEGELEVGQVASAQDATTANTHSDGEYVVGVEYEWDSDQSVPDTEGTEDVLNHLSVDANGGDVDQIGDTPLAVYAN